MYGYTVQLVEVPKTILPRSTASKPLRQPNYGTYYGTRGVLGMPQVVPIVYYFMCSILLLVSRYIHQKNAFSKFYLACEASPLSSYRILGNH